MADSPDDVNLFNLDPSTLAPVEEGVRRVKEEVKGVKDEATKAAEQVQKLANTAIEKMSSKLKVAYNIIEDITGSLENFNFGDSELMGAFDKVAKDATQVFSIIDNYKGFDKIGVVGGAAVRTLGDNFTSLTQRAGGLAGVMKLLPNSMTAGLSTLTQTFGALTGGTLQSASVAQQLETTYMNLLGATGQLGDVFTGNSLRIEDVNNKVAQYGQHMTDSAQHTNRTTEEVTQFASKLGLIPNVLDKLIVGGGGAGKTMDGLTTALTMARGAGVDASIVTETLGTAYATLGNAQGPVTDNAEKGFKMFGLMAQASQELGLRFSDTKTYLDKVAASFQTIGDNTSGATEILSRFSGALQNTGLTAKVSIDIVSGMVDQMSKLSMGTKALISARAGGTGGLQGAFQVENLLRQGKTGDVAAMMEKTLRQQFGGRIYTQEEAAKSPQAASQFMRQRTMLTSGAFGDIAKGDANVASRLLEAMKQGPMATKDVIKNAMENTAAKGEQLQETQVDQLIQVNNELDRLAIIGGTHNLLLARQIVGAGGRTGAETKADEQRKQELMTKQAQKGLTKEENKELQSIGNRAQQGERLNAVREESMINMMENSALDIEGKKRQPRGAEVTLAGGTRRATRGIMGTAREVEGMGRAALLSGKEIGSDIEDLYQIGEKRFEAKKGISTRQQDVDRARAMNDRAKRDARARLGSKKIIATTPSIEPTSALEPNVEPPSIEEQMRNEKQQTSSGLDAYLFAGRERLAPEFSLPTKQSMPSAKKTGATSFNALQSETQEGGRNLMQTLASQTMRQSRPGLELPQASALKHEITTKQEPLEINIKMTRDEGMPEPEIKSNRKINQINEIAQARSGTYATTR